MSDRISLSRATSRSTNSSDDLLSLVQEPIRYIPPLECTKPSYNITQDEINMNNYHQIDIHQVKNIYDYIKNLDLFLAETSVTDSKILHCGNIERIDHKIYFITNYLDTNGNRRRIELNDQHILYINLFNYSMIMDIRRGSSTPAAGGNKINIKDEDRWFTDVFVTGPGFQIAQKFIEGIFDKHIDWTDLISTDDNYKNILQVKIQKEFKVTPHYIELECPEEEGYRMGVYICLGQQIHETDPKNAIPFQQFKTFSKVQEYAKDVQKCLVFMGESYHRIKRKAEQDACMKALELMSS